MKYAPITIYSDWQYSLISFGIDKIKRQFVCLVSHEKKLSMESLILAQDERWRRA